jgi:hypothetical protein
MPTSAELLLGHCSICRSLAFSRTLLAVLGIERDLFDLPNFLAFGPGFFHFQSRQT